MKIKSIARSLVMNKALRSFSFSHESSSTAYKQSVFTVVYDEIMAYGYSLDLIRLIGFHKIQRVSG